MQTNTQYFKLQGTIAGTSDTEVLACSAASVKFRFDELVIYNLDASPERVTVT